MKNKYVSPSFDLIEFQTQNVLLDNSLVFDDGPSAGGDVTVIKPFG